ncbi:MAG: ABC transporter permease, partial [Sedimentisphaerales bacterium]|nr:ABC transporter permease [Sedimentisphaerales bacterium]
FCLGVLVSVIYHRRQGRTRQAWGRVIGQMYEIGIKSLPVVMITGAFIAMTLAVQSFGQLNQLGMADRIGGLINVSVVNELGPVLTAFMLAGRVGGALTAELGTMKVTEQIDAIRAMGSDPVHYLVVPRLLACILLTPILTVYADLLGVLGGYFISVFHFGINAEGYWRFSADVVEKYDLIVGISKGLFFGAAIGLVSCFSGFTCGRGAHGVGKACTKAFVVSFMVILLINFVVAIVSRAVYLTFWDIKSII